MSNLQILSNSIRTFENLYSLNDLHLASGNDPKHRPSFFIRNEQTKLLISEIENERCENSHIGSNRSTKTIFALKTIRGGADIAKQGTWGCKEIVIAYAAWISPQFHLVVLRAFLNQLENSQKNTEIRPLAIEHKTENTQSLSDSELYTLAKVWREVETMRYWLNALQEPLKWLKSPYVDDVLEAQTFRSDIEDFRNIVIKYSGHIQKSSSPNTTITPFEQSILDLRKKWLRLNTAREIIQPIF